MGNPTYSTLNQVWIQKRSSQNLHQMNFPQPSLHLMQLSSGWIRISWRRRKSLWINKRSGDNVKTIDDQNLWSRSPIMWRTAAKIQQLWIRTYCGRSGLSSSFQIPLNTICTLTYLFIPYNNI